MPVIGSGDDDHVHLLQIQDPAEVLVAGRLPSLLLGGHLQGQVAVVIPDVTHGRCPDLPRPEEVPHIAAPHAPGPDEGADHPVVGPQGASLAGVEGGSPRDCCRRYHELASVHFHWLRLLGWASLRCLDSNV